MTGNEIFGPFLAMMLLTAIVWVVLYYRRLSFIFANRIRSQDLTTPEKGAAIIVCRECLDLSGVASRS